MFDRLNPDTILPFKKSWENNQKRQYDYDNHVAWLHGLYIRSAIGSAMSKKNKYPKQPFGKEEKIPDAERFEMFAQAVNSTMKRNKDA